MRSSHDISELWEETFDPVTLGKRGPTLTFLPELEEDEDVIPPLEGTLELGEVIGRGGLADVFSARQGALLREVAVKRIRKSGARLLRAFTQEARLTAGLNHPNILPIHDLVTLDGIAALVMKRVEGHAWNEHLRLARETGSFVLADEVQRLVDVCEAMAFAHSRGVLHLDLKPANVMVGDFGETLVMDWGCAALFDEAHWEHQPGLPRVWNVDKPFGTPAFMAPEQARGRGAAFGPHTDVYLLGAILYRLLADRPLRAGHTVQSMVSAAASGERQPLPDGVPEELGALYLAATAPQVVDRLADVRTLQQGLQHWLDTRESRALTEGALVVVSSLESQDHLSLSERRQGTQVLGVLEQAGRLGSGLPAAVDGERRLRTRLATAALEHEEPGLARSLAQDLPDGERDALVARADALAAEQSRAAAGAQRLRMALRGAGVLLLLALAGVSGLWWQSTVARAEAERERDRATAVRHFTHEMLGAIDPSVAQGLDDTLMRRVLETGQANAEASLARQPGVLLDVLDIIGNTYEGLGAFEQAESVLARSLALSEEVHGPDHPTTLAAANDLAVVYYFRGNYEGAEALYQRALEGRRAALGPEHADTVVSVINLGTLYRAQGRYEQAEALYDSAIESASQDQTHQLHLINNLAVLYQAQGRYEEAEPLFRRAVVERRSRLGPAHPDTLNSETNLGSLYRSQGRYDQALAQYEAALSGRERTLGADHQSTLSTAQQLANVYRALDRDEEAEQLARSVLAAFERTLGPEHPQTLTSVLSVATMLSESGRRDEALPMFMRVVETRERVLGPEHPSTLSSLNELASLYCGLERYDDALALYERTLQAQGRVLGSGHRKTLITRNNIGVVHQIEGRLEQAEQIFRDVLSARAQTLGDQHPDTLGTRRQLGSCLRAQGRHAEASPLFLSALEGYRARGAASSSTLAAAADAVGNLYTLGEDERAVGLRDAVLSTARDALGDTAPSQRVATLLSALEAVP